LPRSCLANRPRRSSPGQFFLLAPYIGFESIRALVGGEHPDALGCAATAGEGRQNMLCAYLAAALLLGLLANALAGAWWLDPAVGLSIAAVAVREVSRPGAARAAARPPLDGAAFAGDDACRDECCSLPTTT
jgi:hypothetical protein